MRALTVEIEFGGKTRRLIFDFNAKAEIQEAAGEFDFEKADFKATRAILYAGLLAETLVVRNGRLRHTKDTLTELQVGEMLGAEIDANPAYIEEVIGKIKQAREAAEPANPPAAEQPSPSTKPGLSDGTTSDSPMPTSGG